MIYDTMIYYIVTKCKRLKLRIYTGHIVRFEEDGECYVIVHRTNVDIEYR